MKVSLAWIFDHIDANWKDYKVDEIVSKFNAVTAEIEEVERVKIDLKPLFLGKVTPDVSVPDVSVPDAISLRIIELDAIIQLPLRTDSGNNLNFLVYRNKNDFRWATCKDVGLDKDGLLPAFDISSQDEKNGWRKLFETEDLIFDVDNKSLTHRPDMWGHRGFAREIAAFLELPLTNKNKFLAKDIAIENFEKKSKLDKRNKFVIEIAAEKACSRFSGLHISAIENKSSNLFIASRLIKVGIRPINAIIDLTNYVMCDWSQPVHAYDAKKVVGDKIIARMAHDGEMLTLLDGQELKLTSQDLVIADGSKAIGLAGVMGGLQDSISAKTTSIFFESADFVPSYIRRTSLRYGIRTDASARFEKRLDPNQITNAILRFVALCHETNVSIKIDSDIICVGKAFEEKTIGVLHSYLEQGITLKKSDVIKPLKRLGFDVLDSEEMIGDHEDRLYTITIPSFRGAKDVVEQEDILEEVVRFFGFNRIAPIMPKLKKEPRARVEIERIRKIQNFLAYAVSMVEQRNYLYYDEDFLKEVDLTFNDCISIKNPVSENNSRLATSLLPGLFKNLKHNNVNENSMRFFETGRTCRDANNTNNNVIEEKKVAGIFFEKRKQIDFYECKRYINDLLLLCDITDVTWKKIDEHNSQYPWVMPYQSAELFIDKVKIGSAGKIEPAFLSKLHGLPESDAFFFELDLDRLLLHRQADIIYTPISKFQGITFDLSFMIPLTLTVSQLKEVLLDSNDLIEHVDLIDFFDNEKWVDQRSIAFRLWVSHPEKTLEKEEIERVRENSIAAAQKLDAQLRS